MSTTGLEEKVLASLDKLAAAFSEGNPEFFDQFASDAMIFTVDSPEPIKGRDAYRLRNLAALTGRTRQKTIVDRTVQLVGDKAVVTQTAQITEAGATADVRQTIVFGETPDGLKVLHHHTALLVPRSADDAAGQPPIRVVNEKIAAVAAVLGVAQ